MNKWINGIGEGLDSCLPIASGLGIKIYYQIKTVEFAEKMDKVVKLFI
jgi:hypothetical protein